jgi:hypothetical protein
MYDLLLMLTPLLATCLGAHVGLGGGVLGEVGGADGEALKVSR